MDATTSEPKPDGSSGRRLGLSLRGHRPIEAGIGLALVLLPFLLGFAPESVADFPPASLVVGGATGLVLVLLGFAGRRGGGALAGRVHAALDAAVVIALLAATMIFAVSGDTAPTIVFAAAALVQAAISVATRYSDHAPGQDPAPDQEPATTMADDRGSPGSDPGSGGAR